MTVAQLDTRWAIRPKIAVLDLTPRLPAKIEEGGVDVSSIHRDRTSGVHLMGGRGAVWL